MTGTRSYTIPMNLNEFKMQQLKKTAEKHAELNGLFPYFIEEVTKYPVSAVLSYNLALDELLHKCYTMLAALSQANATVDRAPILVPKK